MRAPLTALLIAFGLLGLGGAAWAQDSPEAHTRIADRYYQRMAYAQAMDEYRIAADLGALNEHVVMRLAECSMKLGDTDAGEIWYAQVVKFLNREPDDLFMYAQALKGNGKYAQAEEWMDKYLALVPGNGPKTSNLQDFVRKFTSSMDRFTVRSVSINTEQADMFAAWAGDDRVVFSSSRDTTVGMKWRSAWNDAPFLDLYTAERSGNDLINARKVEGNVNSRLHEGPVSVASDGSLWYTRTNSARGTNGVQRLGIYRALAEGKGWAGSEPFLYNNPECSVGHPAISPDGKLLYFMSDMPGGFGGTDLYVCQDRGGRWGEPKNLGQGVNTARNEAFPFVAADGTLYFSSNGLPGLGGFDVFAAKPGVNGEFEYAVNVGAPVNGPKDDFAFIIDKAGKTGYFSSNRPGGLGGDDIYSFIMHKPLEQRYLCTGNVVDDENALPMADAEVHLLDGDGAVLETARTDAQGRYSFPVKEDRRYAVRARAPGHYDGIAHLSTADIGQKQILARDIHLVPDAGIWLRGVVAYEADSSYAQDVKVSVVNLTSFFSEVHQSDAGGDFIFRMQPNEDFEVLLEKPGYFNISVPVSTLGVKQGVIDLGEVRDLLLELVVVGKPLPLKYVLWAGNEVTLSPTARAQLDQLAERMQVNPDMAMEVGVHANSALDATQALKLTQKRADMAVDYLRSKGVNKGKVTGKGYGTTKPLNGCGPGMECTDRQHAENERVEYTVTAITGS